MLVAQMDAMVTPLGPLTGDTSALERELDAVHADRRARRFPARAALRDRHPARRRTAARSSSSPTARSGDAADASGPVHLGDAKLSLRAGRQARHATSAITQFSVRRYPLDKSRYEVMLELTNTGPDAEDVELPLLGDGALVDLTKLRLQAGRAPAALLPAALRARAARSRRRSRASTGRTTTSPADDHAYALLPERRRREGARRHRGQHVPRGGAPARRVPRRDRRRAERLRARPLRRRASGTRSSSTASRPPRCRRPARSTSTRAGPARPSRSSGAAEAAGLRQARPQAPRRPLPRARRREHRRGHKLVPESGDKVVGASDGGASPILVAGHARRVTSSSPSASTCATAICRSASHGRSSSSTASTGSPTRTRSTSRASAPARCGASRWRAACAQAVAEAARRRRRSPCRCTKGARCFLGEQAGFYELTGGREVDAQRRRRVRGEPARRERERDRAQRRARRRRQERRRRSRASTSACGARSGSTSCSRRRS